MTRNRILITLVLVAVVIALAVGGYLYYMLKMPNIPKDIDERSFTIPTGSDFDFVTEKLENEGIIQDPTTFRWVSRRLRYDQLVKPGLYTIQGGWNNLQLVRLLRSGNQTPVDVVINNVRFVNEIAGRAGMYLEPDSVEISNYLLQPSTIQQSGVSRENLLTLFIPNTYEMWWTSTPEDFFQRMKIEHEKFWENNNRRQKAESIGLSPHEVYTLASIVEKETRSDKEKPVVAGLYLNRLERGIPLQADPTVVYANNDFSLRRVLNKHLQLDSPYNTYKFAGLPPGPIYMPSITSIEAVLNANEHDYIYMCSRADNSGLHAFAKTLAQHNRNAAAYRQWLNARGIF